MSLFHVQVRDYVWMDDRDATGQPKNKMVQSPLMTLPDEPEPMTVRLLQGPKRLEVVRLASAWGVRDTTPNHPNVYTADAHGVILTDGPSPGVHPVWIYTEGSRCSSGHLGPNAASVVDIATNKIVDTRFPQVCWLPHRERQDGTLVTFLHEVPRKLGRIREFFVVLQMPGRPGETTAAWMSEEERRQCCPLDGERQKAKFDAQLLAFRSPARRPPPASLDLTLLSVLRRLAGGSAKSSFRGRSSAHPVPTLCCRHPELGPTASDPAPKHRHTKDTECDWGKNHGTHCVFREEAPETCVLTWHRHCSRAMQDIFGDLERDPIVEGLDFDMYSYSPELNAASLRSSPAPPAPTSFLLPLGCDELMTDEAPDGLVSFPGEGGGCQFASRRMKRPPHPRPRFGNSNWKPAPICQ